MPNPETALQQRIRLAVSELGGVLWRNNSGRATYLHGPQAHEVAYGVGKGGADLLGYTPVPVIAPVPTADTGMARRVKLPVWTAVEVKSPTGRLRPNQRRYLEGVARDGGLAIVARSVEDATGPIARALAGDTGVLGVVHGLEPAARAGRGGK